MEPKNCPFCKSLENDVLIDKTFFSGIQGAYVVCECGAKGPYKHIDYVDSEEIAELDSEEIEDYMVEKAVDAWNNRG